MTRDDVIADRLKKKLTKPDPSTEVVSGVITAIIMIAVIFAIPSTEGWVRAGLIFAIVLQSIGLLSKLAGWKSVTLNNEEQDYLKRNYGRKLDNKYPF